MTQNISNFFWNTSWPAYTLYTEVNISLRDEY